MDAAGHRSDVRCVAISPDNALVCSAFLMACELWLVPWYLCLQCNCLSVLKA